MGLLDFALGSAGSIPPVSILFPFQPPSQTYEKGRWYMRIDPHSTTLAGSMKAKYIEPEMKSPPRRRAVDRMFLDVAGLSTACPLPLNGAAKTIANVASARSIT